ncbi:Kri1 domain-containing protein/Kri1_C domain-containing protein, partial [Cephalotus follicularis]
KDVKLFEYDESEEKDEKGRSELNEQKEKNKEEKKKKPKYLKDVVATRLIEEGPELEDEDVDDRKKSYNEEQEEIKKEFLDAVEEFGNDEGNFLKQKETGNENEEAYDNDDDGEFAKKLDEYFGGDGELDDSQTFLKEFFRNKMWVDKEKKDKRVVIDDEEVDEVLRDEEEIEMQEEYESNFRYEENVGDRVMGNSWRVEGSVRKKENARKDQRKSKENRMKIAEMEREEHLKHLKNLKKQEIKEKMKKVMEIARFKEEKTFPLKTKDLEDDFDPEAYDRLMKVTYNDQYYNKDDVDPTFGEDREEDWVEVKKPNFEKEDELLGLPKGWDVLESTDGFLAARERSLKLKLKNGGGEEEEEEETKESKRKRKRKMSLVKRAQEEMMEEYYKLDYEDTIGNLKTRFKYAKLKPNRYGLSTAEILMMEENELNQYVPLKKLAPYIEKEWKVNKNKRYQQKLKNKELDGGGKLDGHKSDKKKRFRDGSDLSTSATANEHRKEQMEESNGDDGNLSRRAKRRRRQAEKLPQSRLVAYGR